MPGRLSLSMCVAAAAVTVAPIHAIGADLDWNVHVSPDWGNYMENLMGAAPISARDFALYGETLGLDAGQTDLAGELYADYAEELRNMSTRMTEKRADMQASAQATQNWQNVQQSYTEVSQEQNEKSRLLTQQLFADLRLIITPEQESAWAEVERVRRRRETLTRFAVYPRERIDLIAVVQGLEMPESFRTSLGPVLENYEHELDVVIVARNAKATAATAKAKTINEIQMTAWSPSPDQDPQAMMDAQQRVQEMQQDLVPVALDFRDACARVRDVNDRYIRELASRFPEKMRNTFDAQIGKIAGKSQNTVPFSDFSRAKMAIQTLEQMEAMKPMMEMQAQMFGDSDMAAEMQPYLDRLKNISPLSRDQRDQLAQIKEDVEAELDALQRKHAGANETPEEPKSFTMHLDGIQINMAKSDAENMMRRAGDPEDQDKELARERAEINQRAIDRIRDILTIEQRSMIAQF